MNLDAQSRFYLLLNFESGYYLFLGMDPEVTYWKAVGKLTTYNNNNRSFCCFCLPIKHRQSYVLTALFLAQLLLCQTNFFLPSRYFHVILILHPFFGPILPKFCLFPTFTRSQFWISNAVCATDPDSQNNFSLGFALYNRRNWIRFRFRSGWVHGSGYDLRENTWYDPRIKPDPDPTYFF